ncbi:MAG: hypothetical protein M1449_03625 [Candidatus Thermoplasmatota archaeon]|nr:hypothetical protein [Candidatus Thermoplasmatota archaeon]
MIGQFRAHRPAPRIQRARERGERGNFFLGIRQPAFDFRVEPGFVREAHRHMQQ